MKLWSDYEGRTIAEAYPLKKLVRPEGRSAFFLTTNGTGTPALVRVIEAHFDESEILTRWRAVSEIGQENLVTMRKFGQTELDGTPLVYAVMEPTEISLAELLQNRTLSAEETLELAHSMVGALQALHQRGLVHGQVEPDNILAAGETVKLRSDCVRAVVDYPDSDSPTLDELKAQDAHALAVVLLQALTGRTSLQGSATLLPSPFDGIIRNGLSGRWGLVEMAAALGPVKRKTVPAPVAPAAATVPAVTPAAKPEAAAAKTETPAGGPRTEAVSALRPVPAPVIKPEPTKTPAQATQQPAPQPTQESLFAANGAASTAAAAKPTGGNNAGSTSPRDVAASLAAMKAAPTKTPDVRHRIVRPMETTETNRTKLWVGIAAAVLVLLLIGWRMMRSAPATANEKPVSTLGDPVAAKAAATGPTTTTATKPSATRYANSKAAPAPVSKSSAPAASKPRVPVVTGGAGEKTLWRVVAYTYNHEDQARQKAESIRGQHASLQPEVFSPSGRAPFLVTVGGAMSHDQAESFLRKARGEGLPRDIYTQNYSR
jgi:hypothetical protein